MKDPVCPKMRQELISSRCRRLNNTISRADDSPVSVKESAQKRFESPNIFGYSPPSSGSALQS